MVLRAPWKKVSITPVDISVKTRHDEALVARIARAGTPLARYIEKFHRKQPPAADPDWVPWIFMWDEVSAASVLDPSIITRSREMYVDVDIDHGLNYGNTLAWEPTQGQPVGVRKATVQFDLDLPRFYDLYVNLMTRLGLGRSEVARRIRFFHGRLLRNQVRGGQVELESPVHESERRRRTPSGLRVGA
jgi:inosine-uridine nucleoside N-ribohydrolase